MGNEKSVLKPFAAGYQNDIGSGRVHIESSAFDRNEYERDLSRITHSGAFRLLQYKTQVFANHQGDFFRTRLTHSMEVAQLASSVCKVFGLNDTLASTIALAHDLGHAPFGHLGQDILNEKMSDAGGFEHNWQALRIVDKLESPYLGFDGLNLLFDTREGILKHCSAKNAKSLGAIGERFLADVQDPKSYKSPSIEAQITDVCDAIAYNHADLEDSIMMNVLTVEQAAAGLPLFKRFLEEVEDKYGKMTKSKESRYVREVTGRMIKESIIELIKETHRRLELAKPQTISDVRRMRKIAGLSESFAKEYHLPMKQFLRANVYHHDDIECLRHQQAYALETLFDHVLKKPKKFIETFEAKHSEGVERQVCDFISGLTDRKAIDLFNQISPTYTSESSLGVGKTRRPGMRM